MRQSLSLAIAVCTRNRCPELTRAVHSILRDAATLPAPQRASTELLIVDDGQLPSEAIADFARNAERVGLSFRYFNKSDRPGLLRSRIAALGLTDAGIVLFVDDDIEMTSGYLVRMLAHFQRRPDLAGVGGIDILGRPEPWTRTVASILTGAAALRLGHFSSAGFNGDCARWPRARRPFHSEYLVGFNMSFRARALAGLAERDWLSGYGLGEDLYVSVHARRYGSLIVDPNLKVAHHLSPSTFDGRDNLRRYHAAKASHHAYLLVEMNAGPCRFVMWRAAALALLLHHAASWIVTRPGPLRAVRLRRLHGCFDGVREGWAVWPSRTRPSPSGSVQ